MKKTLLFLFSLALCLTACQNEDDVINDDTPKFTLKAVFENDNEADATRTTVGTDGYTRWEIGDRIDVMWEKKGDINPTASLFYVTELNNNGKMATFTEFSENFKWAADEAGYFAGYPAGKYSASLFPYTMNCTINSVQTYDAENMVASTCNPAYAWETKGDFEANKMFHFKNLCGLLHLKFKGDAKIKAIRFKTTGNQYVCGIYNFPTTPEAAELIPPSWTNGGNTVTLDCGSGVQLTPTTTTDFYIVLPPATYSNFTIEIECEDEFLPKIKTPLNSHTITRSKIHTISTITCNKGEW